MAQTSMVQEVKSLSG